MDHNIACSDQLSKARDYRTGQGKALFLLVYARMHKARFQLCAVGQFKDLVESSAKDIPLQETLRKVLNFTSKGWDAAKAHALRAVETDNLMRVWLSDDSCTSGLLFQCHLGRIHIDSPIGGSSNPNCTATHAACGIVF